MRKKIPLLLFCLSLICVMLAGTRAANAQLSTISVDPPSQDINEPAILFTVNITITDAPTLTQFIIKNITWNPDVVELETGTIDDFVEGPFLKEFGGTVWLVKKPDNVTGIAPEVSGAYISGGPCPGGDGVLFTIKFRSKAVGSSDIHLQIAWLLDGLNMADTPTLEDGTVTVIPEFPMSILLPIFLIATTTIAILAKTLISRRRQEYTTAPHETKCKHPNL